MNNGILAPLAASSKFPIGQTVITPGALELHPEDVLIGLKRHCNCDWGDLDKSDKRLNDEAVKTDIRIFSAYHDRNKTKFWIITEADRSSTCILLPSEY